ncbi:MAG: hypothetical protein KGN79_11975, partial [Acidobacteriota bacterium]|nr:hypothetical protein [Acidobacteriota bacterium]
IVCLCPHPCRTYGRKSNSQNKVRSGWYTHRHPSSYSNNEGYHTLTAYSIDSLAEISRDANIGIGAPLAACYSHITA